MKFLLVHPSWDHTETLGSLMFYFKKTNHEIKIIYNWDHPEGNFIDYFIELNDIEHLIKKINYKSPKHHQRDFKWANIVIFLDSIHLPKFLNKNTYQEMINKIFAINHFERCCSFDKVKLISLGKLPFLNNTNSMKYKINTYFNPDLSKRELNPKVKQYLIVGNPRFRDLDLLKELPKRDDYKLIYVHRRNYEINHPNISVLTNVDTKDLIDILNKTDYIITLFKYRGVYHRDRICGIIPLAISFGIPIISDKLYSKLNDFNFIDNKLLYINSKESFKNSFENSLNLSRKDYNNYSYEILKYRDNLINEQYINFSLLFF